MKNFIYLSIMIAAMLIVGLTARAFDWKFLPQNEVRAFEVPVSQTTTTDLEILPTMDSDSVAKNQVWVGTFQLVWNDLINEIIKCPIEFIGYKSVMAENLNKQDFTTNDLSESAYYKKWGLASPVLKKEIEDGIKEKFDETSDILDAFDWTPAPDKYFLYAMLKKDFEYIQPFAKLPDGDFNGSEGKVKYFGTDENSGSALRRTIRVLYYNNQNDCALSLRSEQGDVIYLYRTNEDKKLSELYKDMVAKSDMYRGNKSFASIDKFKAPVIDFKTDREFPELYNKIIKNTSFFISKAIESVQFKMDEVGVKLKSEAGIMLEKSVSPISLTERPRYFYFNGKYAIFLIEEGKSKPYFALKISDAEKLQK